MKGSVQWFDPVKRFGKIQPEGGGEPLFVHRNDFVDKTIATLLEGESVEFEIEQGDRGPKAVQVRRLEPRLTGRVVTFSSGWGKIQPDDGTAPVFVHYRNILTGGKFKVLEEDEIVEFSVSRTPKGPEAIRVTKDPRLPLERFAIILDLDTKIDELARLAQPEEWNYKYYRQPHPLPILRSYPFYTFARLQEEERIATSTDVNGRPVACFNTGLVTPFQEEIFAFFTHNNRPDIGDQTWFLQVFFKESDRQMLRFNPRPDIANYFDDPSVLLYDAHRDLVINYDHIVKPSREGGNLERFPAALQINMFALQQLVSSAVESAKRRVRRNYKAAVPQYHRG
jgi:cold shock CspA family protein